MSYILSSKTSKLETIMIKKEKRKKNKDHETSWSFNYDIINIIKNKYTVNS
jgi:hypothetical protein